MKSKQRFIVYALRHKPDAIPVTLDHEGYCEVTQLLENLKITRKELGSIIEQSGGRLVLSEDGKKIRAAHGHSVNVDYDYSDVPPDVLYHGTSVRFLQPILDSGFILPMKRTAVHLSESREDAIRVGLRHAGDDRSCVVVLEIDAKTMHEHGQGFHRSEDGVWLTPFVPFKYVFSFDGCHDEELEQVDTGTFNEPKYQIGDDVYVAFADSGVFAIRKAKVTDRQHIEPCPSKTVKYYEYLYTLVVYPTNEYGMDSVRILHAQPEPRLFDSQDEAWKFVDGM